jgi:hypothetical protein
MRKCAFVPVDDKHYYPEGTPIMINSFKKFHPDIDLVIFRQDVADKLFKEKGINWYNAKPYFAELLEPYYDLIVNMDADHVVTGRMTEIFDNVDYDIAGPSNFNDYENMTVENITEDMYIQGGMVASTSHEFWKVYREENVNAKKYRCRENDIFNLIVYNKLPHLKFKMVDKDKDYYGCKSLNREGEFYIENDKLMCRGEQVLAYHNAKGGVFPKLDFDNMPFTDEVKKWLKNLSFGQSYKAVAI